MSEFSYLEFGSIDSLNGKRIVYDYRTHNKAYEWLMHARYSNDIVSYKHMQQAISKFDEESCIDIFKTEIHHQDDLVVNNNKLLALSISGGSFFELGQTLFGCIDGMEFLTGLNEKIIGFKEEVDLRKVKWLGVDISDFFNMLAPMLHAQYDIKVSTEYIKSSVDVFFAKGITLLYAIRSAQQLSDFVLDSKISIFDYSFSLNDEKFTQVGTGKDVSYLSKDEFLIFYDNVRSAGKDIWVRNNSGPKESTDLFYFEGVVCDESLAKLYISKQTSWYTTFKEASPLLYSSLVHQRGEEYWSWSKLSDVMHTYDVR